MIVLLYDYPHDHDGDHVEHPYSRVQQQAENEEHPVNHHHGNNRDAYQHCWASAPFKQRVFHRLGHYEAGNCASGTREHHAKKFWCDFAK